MEYYKNHYYRRFKRMLNKIRHLGRNDAPIINRILKDGLTFLRKDSLYDLYDCIKKIEREEIEGIFIEAGCALGGSAILAASAKNTLRPFFVYDVFSMIPPPTEKDGLDAHKRFQKISSGKSEGIGNNLYYGYLDDLLSFVQSNFYKYNLPLQENNITLVKGLFEHTLIVESKVAFAHIDGDWYESVRICLERIVPYLGSGGVIIVDDYDDWIGCKSAVDDYFRNKNDLFRYIYKSRLHIIRK